MSTITVAPAPARVVPARIPFGRIVWVELTKMFNTRSGFWLTASIGITALLATAAVIVFAPDSRHDVRQLRCRCRRPDGDHSCPSSRSFRSPASGASGAALTTFTLVPKRGQVIWAKLLIAVALGVSLDVVAALGIGAVGNVVGAAITGIDPVWGISLNQATSLVAANVLGLLIGFMLGVLIRNSAAAIVGYFIYGFVLGGLAAVLAASQEWFRDLQPWIDFNYTQGLLFEGWPVGGEAWAQLGVTAVGWVVVPLAVGLWLVRRSEVK